MQHLANCLGCIAKGGLNLWNRLALGTGKQYLRTLEHERLGRVQTRLQLLAFRIGQRANEDRWFHHHQVNTLTLLIRH